VTGFWVEQSTRNDALGYFSDHLKKFCLVFDNELDFFHEPDFLGLLYEYFKRESAQIRSILVVVFVGYKKENQGKKVFK
jgi:hypothetical protein